MIDQLIIGFDRALRTVFANAHTVRPVPGGDRPEADMSDEERRHAAALMRSITAVRSAPRRSTRGRR